MNIYSFTGRLGRDCETRFTQAGMAICSFTVAVDYGFDGIAFPSEGIVAYAQERNIKTLFTETCCGVI